MDSPRDETRPCFSPAALANGCTVVGGCSRPIVAFIATFTDPGQGFHVHPPLTLWPFCPRHRRAVQRRVAAEGTSFLPTWKVDLAHVDDLVAWYFAAGLSSATAISVVQAYAPLETTPDDSIPRGP